MKKALIVCSIDAFANSVKPAELEKMLRRLGYEVELFSTTGLGRLGKTGVRRLLPALNLTAWSMYCLEAIQVVANKTGHRGLKRTLTSLVLQPTIRLRGRLLQKALRPGGYDLMICEYMLDEAIVEGRRLATVQILDLPSPFAEEVYYGGELTRRAYERLRDYEITLYGRADHLSFHWWTYAEYVKQTKYDGDNFIDASYGVSAKTQTVRYAAKPRVVFLGYLAGYWVNMPLLEELSRLYPNIDVYGGPPPEPGTAINYKGYLPEDKKVETLAKYQFGLITISDDDLRKHSFSSKQLEYYSYGLPVLTPSWRPDRKLEKAAVYYDAATFVDAIERASQRDEWQRLSHAAKQIGDELAWDKALKPIERIARHLKQN